MSDLADLVAAATAQLRAAGVPSPDSDALILLAHVRGVGLGEVRRLVILGRPLTAAQTEAYAALLEERANRVPLQHLTGLAGFRRLELAVGPGVFVPRPETELVAGLAIAAAESALGPVVVDLCTGSGAIALAVKDEVPEAVVLAVEISELAHAWARRNIERTGLDVELRLGDATVAFPELVGAVDVVVSNPPYIPAGMEPVDPEVRDHDPSVALFGGGDDGLVIPLAVARRAAVLLRPGGVLIMEHADSQGETLPAALRHTGEWRAVRDERDLNDRPRATVAVRV